MSGSEVLHLIDLLDGFVGPIDHRVHTRPYYVTMVVRTLKDTVTELVELPHIGSVIGIGHIVGRDKVVGFFFEHILARSEDRRCRHRQPQHGHIYR